MVAASLIIISSDPSATFLLSIPVTLCIVGLEVLVPRGRMTSSEDTTMDPFNWKLILPLGHLDLFLMLLKQQVKKRVTVLVEVTDHDY